MKTITIALSTFLFVSICVTSCKQETKTEKNEPVEETVVKIKSEELSYDSDTAKLVGFVSYNENAKEKLPVILIVHEWWGLNDYAKNRAKQLADLGYLAFAIDMYGDGKTADNPGDAQKLATPFYQNPVGANTRIQAALNKIKTFAQADTTKIIAIGYCFGGSMVLNAAKGGLNLNGVVSFHGGLAGLTPEKGKTKADVLVCHGAADQFVPATDITKFKTQLDSVGASYKFIEYDNATHAFTNPDATENGKKFNIPIAYNEKADKASWKDMLAFFEKVLKK